MLFQVQFEFDSEHHKTVEEVESYITRQVEEVFGNVDNILVEKISG